MQAYRKLPGDSAREQDLQSTPYIFVYGTLMRSYGNHRVLAYQDAKYVRRGETVGSYQMFTSSALTTFPKVFSAEGSTVPIKGELYHLGSIDALAACDSLEGHPNWYRRQKVRVATAGGVVTAWMYIMDPSEDKSGWVTIPSGDWRDVTKVGR